ncbi:YnfA family protein [Janthinobacterium sp. 17J80-10]|nr:YnfA family protein [Janthinobacterium sp. 17J80-10]
MTTVPRTFGLFFLTAVAELLGCYLPLLWITGKGSIWLLAPAILSLAAFVWLLTLHPAASGRIYATYGAVYIAAALLWLWLVDGVTPTTSDLVGVGFALFGAAVIVVGQGGAK